MPATPAFADDGALPDWGRLIEAAGLRGPLGQLAQNCALREREGNVLVLVLQSAHMHLAVEPMISQMEDRIGVAMGRPVRLRFVEDRLGGSADTPAARAALQRDNAQRSAEASIEADPLVQALKRDFGARVVPQSIRAIEP